MNLYPNLKALRLQNNYKQEFVADILGVSQPEYSKMENGQRKLDAFAISELCKLYDVSIDLLLRNIPMPELNEKPSDPIHTGRQLSHLPTDVLNRLMDNYSNLLDSYLKQQQVQEKIIDKLINFPPDNRSSIAV